MSDAPKTRCFYIELDALAFDFPQREYLVSVIMENNTEAVYIPFHEKLWHSPLVIRCQNQPRDLPMYGIVWKEFVEDAES